MIITNAFKTALDNPSIQPVWFFWFKAKNRLTGDFEQDGLWTGIEPITVSVDGVARTYSGAGGLIQLDNFAYRVGTTIQTQTVTLSILDPSVFTAIRTYEPKYAPVQVHLGLIDPITETFVGMTKVFDGFIDTITENETLESATCEVTLVPSFRNATRPLYAKQSDHYQRLRNSADTGRAYASVAGNVTVYWGRRSDHTPSGNGTGVVDIGWVGRSD